MIPACPLSRLHRGGLEQDDFGHQLVGRQDPAATEDQEQVRPRENPGLRQEQHLRHSQLHIRILLGHRSLIVPSRPPLTSEQYLGSVIAFAHANRKILLDFFKYRLWLELELQFWTKMSRILSSIVDYFNLNYMLWLSLHLCRQSLSPTRAPTTLSILPEHWPTQPSEVSLKSLYNSNRLKARLLRSDTSRSHYWKLLLIRFSFKIVVQLLTSNRI